MARVSATELNIRHINKLIKQLKAGQGDKMETIKTLNRRFDRLKKESLPWYEDLYPKYINVVRLGNQKNYAD